MSKLTKLLVALKRNNIKKFKEDMKPIFALIICLVMTVPAHSERKSRQEVLADHGFREDGTVVLEPSLTFEGRTFEYSEPNGTGRFVIAVTPWNRRKDKLVIPGEGGHPGFSAVFDSLKACDGHRRPYSEVPEGETVVLGTIGCCKTHRPIYDKKTQTIIALTQCRRIKKASSEK